jgi:hypothetical protein
LRRRLRGSTNFDSREMPINKGDPVTIGFVVFVGFVMFEQQVTQVTLALFLSLPAFLIPEKVIISCTSLKVSLFSLDKFLLMGDPYWHPSLFP